MKKIITLLFLFISFNSIAVTNQELMDRLDDLELEAELREGRRLMDEARRSIDRMKQQNQQLKNEKPSNFKHIGTSFDENYFFIDLRTITKNNLGNFVYVLHTSSDKPRNSRNVVYFYAEIRQEINCIENKVRALKTSLFSFDYKLLYTTDNYMREFSAIPEKSTIESIKKYLCN